MNSAETPNELSTIEKRLSALESKKKDFWDIFSIIVSLLTPIAIALAGYFFSDAVTRTQIASSEKLGEQNIAIARINSRVEQAKLISTFMEALTSENPQRQRIAISAILYALPEDGPEFVRTISREAPNAEVRQYATTSLDERRAGLVQNLFSDNSDTRKAAAVDLLQGYGSDQGLIPVLIETANRNRNNGDGIYNTVVVLNGVDKNSLLAHQEDVKQFLSVADANGPKTKQVADQVRARLR